MHNNEKITASAINNALGTAFKAEQFYSVYIILYLCLTR